MFLAKGKTQRLQAFNTNIMAMAILKAFKAHDTLTAQTLQSQHVVACVSLELDDSLHMLRGVVNHKPKTIASSVSMLPSQIAKEGNEHPVN